MRRSALEWLRVARDDGQSRRPLLRRRTGVRKSGKGVNAAGNAAIHLVLAEDAQRRRCGHTARFVLVRAVRIPNGPKRCEGARAAVLGTDRHEPDRVHAIPAQSIVELLKVCLPCKKGRAALLGVGRGPVRRPRLLVWRILQRRKAHVHLVRCHGTDTVGGAFPLSSASLVVHEALQPHCFAPLVIRGPPLRLLARVHLFQFVDHLVETRAVGVGLEDLSAVGFVDCVRKPFQSCIESHVLKRLPQRELRLDPL